MANRDRFFIGPLNTGLENNVKPWLLPDDAFEKLNNAYIFRGRVKKRFGSYPIAETSGVLNSRLRINLGTTDGSGNLSGVVPGVKYNIGQQFSIGTEVFTVTTTGTPTDMITTGTTTTKTYNTSSGVFVIQGATALTACYFYPFEPVMGLPNFENTAINFEPLLAFDTQFSYQFLGNEWVRLGTTVWTGSDSDFFWTVNYRGTAASDTFLFATNFVVADQVKYWDGAAWNAFVPVIDNAGNTLETCRVIVSFKDRLLFLNTVEKTKIGGANNIFGSRCRYSQNGNPEEADAWNEDIPGKGGYVSAATKQQIVSARLIRDRLVVFFERSTWEIVYTGNQIEPFVWQQINSELGVESPFSTVPFDRVVIGVGDVGVHACTGASVDRIDEKIPDEVFSIRNTNSATNRVYGIRDYFTETVYWTFPISGTFAQKVLVYNYSSGTWAFFDDSFTCFGYFQPNDSKLWATSFQTWKVTGDPWADPQYNARFRSVVAGNQQGYVSIIDKDRWSNAKSMSITDISSSPTIFTSVNHNLLNGDFVLVSDVESNLPAGFESLNGSIFKVTVATVDTFILYKQNPNPDDPEKTIKVNIADTYKGGGNLSRVSKIDILTKEYNFYREQGESVDINKVDFYVDKTAYGQITIDPLVSSSSLSMADAAIVTKSGFGSPILETYAYPTVTLEDSQTRLWHPVYVQAAGSGIQLNMYLSDEQMFDKDISQSSFELHAMIFHAFSGSNRLE